MDPVTGGHQQDSILRFRAEDRRPAIIVQQLAVLRQEERGVRVELRAGSVPWPERDAGQGRVQPFRDRPLDAVVGNAELRVLVVVGPKGIGRHGHEPRPASGPPALGDMEDVGVRGLAGPVGGRQVQEDGGVIRNGPVQASEGRAEGPLRIPLHDPRPKRRNAEAHAAQALLCLADEAVEHLSRTFPLKAQGQQDERRQRAERRHGQPHRIESSSRILWNAARARCGVMSARQSLGQP